MVVVFAVVLVIAISFAVIVTMDAERLNAVIWINTALVKLTIVMLDARWDHKLVAVSMLVMLLKTVA
jgi:hypothetical protein